MQKFIAKYGLAAHLAILAVAPLFLFPFCSDRVVAAALLWLSLLTGLWMLLGPSMYGGERLHDARRRVASDLLSDPLSWVLLAGIIFSGLRALNTGIAFRYNAETAVWYVSSATVPIFPGVVGSSGDLDFAVAVAFSLNRLEIPQVRVENRDAPGRGMLRMLLEPSVLLLVGVFALAVCHEVWMNLAMPGFLRDRYGWGDSRMGLGAGVYFFAKIPVMLVGSVLLSKFPPSRFLLPCVLSVAVGTMILLLAPTAIVFLCGVLLVSVGSANFFGIIFGMLTERHPGKLDALSALLVLSISLGAVVSPVMAFCGWRF